MVHISGSESVLIYKKLYNLLNGLRFQSYSLNKNSFTPVIISVPSVNREDRVNAAYYEPPHLDLHCLSSGSLKYLLALNFRHEVASTKHNSLSK